MKKIIPVVILILISIKSSAQSSLVAAVPGYLMVKDIFNKAQQSGSVLLNQATSDGNALIAQLGNQLNVSVANANILLEKDLNTSFDHLNTEDSKIVAQIYQLNLTAQSIMSNAYNLEGAANLDLREIFGSAWPPARINFYIQSIGGIAQLRNDSTDYKLSIMGIGFGYDSEKFKSKIVGVKGVPSLSFSETKVAAHQSILQISSKSINAKANPSKITPIQLNVTVEVTYRKGFLFHHWETKDFTFPITLSVIPATLDGLSISYEIPVYSWVTIADPITYSYTTPNHDQSGGDIHTFTYDATQSCDSNHRYINPRHITSGGPGCPWTRIEFIRVEQNNTVLHAQYSTWGLPCSYTYGATYQERKATGVQQNHAAITQVQYGNNLVITIPNNCTYWQIEGKTVDFNPILIPEKRNYNNLFVFQDVYDDGVNLKIIYAIGKPSLNSQ